MNNNSFRSIDSYKRNVRCKTDGIEFSSLNSLATYLSSVTNVKVEPIRKRLTKRRKNVLGYSISYL